MKRHGHHSGQWISINVLIEKFASRFVNEVDTAGQSADQNTLSITGHTDTRHHCWTHTLTHTCYQSRFSCMILILFFWASFTSVLFQFLFTVLTTSLQSIVISVSVYFMSVCSHISQKTQAQTSLIFLYMLHVVTTGSSSDDNSISCFSGFVDDIFSHNGAYY